MCVCVCVCVCVYGLVCLSTVCPAVVGTTKCFDILNHYCFTYFVLQELDSSVVAGAVADVTSLCAVLQDQELDPNAVAGAQVAV